MSDQKFFYLCLCLVLLSLSGCDSSGSSKDQNNFTTASVFGTVTEADPFAKASHGLQLISALERADCSALELAKGGRGPIVDGKVLVSSGGKSIFSDSNGFFYLADIPRTADGKVLVTFSHVDDLFCSYQQSWAVEADQKLGIAAVLERNHISQTIDNTGIVKSEGHGEILFPQELVGYKASVYFGDPTGSGGSTFPGEYLAKLDRSSVSLMSVAFSEIKVTDYRGEEIKELPSPAKVKMRLPQSFQDGTILNLLTNQPYKAGDTIPWWSYNDQEGIWEREDAFPGSDQKYDADVTAGEDGLYIESEITHLSWWNGDIPLEQTTILVKVVDVENKPLKGIFVKADGVTYSGRSFTSITNEEGIAQVTVKRSQSEQNRDRVKVSAYVGTVAFGNMVVETPWNSGSGDLVAEIKIQWGKIFGIVKDINNIPKQGEYVFSDCGAYGITGQDGKYELNKVPIGIPVQVWLNNFYWKSIQLEDETPQELNFIQIAPPQVKIISPQWSSNPVAPGSSVLFTIEVQGEVVMVEFFVNGQKVDTVETIKSRSTFTTEKWGKSLPKGNYVLYATAQNSQGVFSQSGSVYMLVDSAPSTTLIAPISGSYTTPVNLIFQANAQDSRLINRVEFQARNTSGNGSYIWKGTAVSSPYTYEWKNVPEGNYDLRAIAIDDSNLRGTSNVISGINVSNPAPSIEITSPVSGTYPSGNFAIQAQAQDQNGTISKVDFYVNNSLLSTDITEPYNAIWSASSTGSYILTAKATDNEGKTTTSNPVAVEIQSTVPTVMITYPAQGQQFSAPANINIQATASDPYRSVSKVEFFQGATKLGEDSTVPYTFAWQNVEEGNYTLQAKATDNQGNLGESALVSIVVGNSPAQNLKITVLEEVTLLPLKDVYVILYYPNNKTIQETKITGNDGIADFGNIGRDTCTVTFAYDDRDAKKRMGNNDRRDLYLHTMIEIPTRHFIWKIFDKSYLHEINVTITPTPVAAEEVIIEPFGSWDFVEGDPYNIVENVYSYNMQNDGKLSLLAFLNSYPVGMVGYGYLLDQNSENGKNFIIPPNEIPKNLSWTSDRPASFISVSCYRKGVKYFLCEWGVAPDEADISGIQKYAGNFPADVYFLSATMLLNNNKDYYQKIRYSSIPDSVAFSMPDLDISASYNAESKILSWTITGNTSRDIFNFEVESIDDGEKAVCLWTFYINPDTKNSIPIPDLPEAMQSWIDVTSSDKSVSVVDYDHANGFIDLVQKYMDSNILPEFVANSQKVLWIYGLWEAKDHSAHYKTKLRSRPSSFRWKNK
ncbi:MAG: hypothetical protein HUU50_10240 [Candidatus Brocadiae bacterium]|nr:hypothetical protein [Candidatus Brocadiia bacterium]